LDWKREGVSCLIADVVMPEMSGMHLQEALKAAGHDLPIIFITAHDDPDIKERALRAGAVAFLRKPFEDTLLFDAIHRAIDVHRECG